MSTIGKRKRVAILGGGPSALATAYYLSTREPDSYDIHVYEMSWRLGGKTASGRGEEGRIEEHGLHVLFGCYHNVFDMMVGCYDALARALPDDSDRFQHFFDAIEPNNFGVIGDDRYPDVGWIPWPLQFPSNRGVPGDPPLPTTWQLLASIFQVAIHVIVGPRVVRRIQRWGGKLFGYGLLPRPRAVQRANRLGGDLPIHLAMRVGRWLLDRRTLGGRLVLLLLSSFHALWAPLEGPSGARRAGSGPLGRVWSAVDLGVAVVKGIVRDLVLVKRGHDDLPPVVPASAAPRRTSWGRLSGRLMPRYGRGGFEGIDHLDFREWLRLHGAAEDTCNSPLVRIVYDAAFSYPEGGKDVKRPESMAAGALLRIALLVAITYKNALYFKMRAGMGDVVSAPLYRLLRHRGVTFHFFHKVTAVKRATEAEAEASIAEVHLQRLASLAPEVATYDPLVKVAGVWCWPSRPDLTQLDPRTHEHAVEAERFFSSPSSAEPPLVLRARAADETDGFDRFVLAVPVACIPYVCGDLVKAAATETDADRARWANAQQISTVQTAAVQLWCKDTIEELGWTHPSPLLSLFLDPLNTYCDMRQVLDAEPWPGGRRPRMVGYFCGALPHNRPLPRPGLVTREEALAFRRAAEREASDACNKLLHELAQIFPRVEAPPGLTALAPFNWSILFDPLNRRGPERLKFQYVRANYDPHERCTLALPGETRLRMHADRTGYSNLVVAGDWIANGIYAACFEGAVQGGIRAARAVAAEERRHLYTIEAEQLLDLATWTWRSMRKTGKVEKEGPPAPDPREPPSAPPPRKSPVVRFGARARRRPTTSAPGPAPAAPLAGG